MLRVWKLEKPVGPSPIPNQLFPQFASGCPTEKGLLGTTTHSNSNKYLSLFYLSSCLVFTKKLCWSKGSQHIGHVKILSSNECRSTQQRISALILRPFDAVLSTYIVVRSQNPAGSTLKSTIFAVGSVLPIPELPLPPMHVHPNDNDVLSLIFLSLPYTAGLKLSHLEKIITILGFVLWKTLLWQWVIKCATLK